VRILFGTRASPRTLVAATLGILGVALLFAPELARTGVDAAFGIAFSLAATAFASIGNLIAVRNHRRRLPVLPATAWGMTYGTIVVAIVAVLHGAPWRFDLAFDYVASLMYLAAFGSVVAFVSYLTLLGEIGAARAGYVGVAVPLVALALSTAFESYRWTIPAIVGAAMCVAGNVLVLLPERSIRAAAAREEGVSRR